MEPLETLHKGLSQSFCLCHLETRTILEQLDLGSAVTGQGTVETSARDQVLVRLSLLTHLGESNHCRKLREVQGTLFTSDRLEHIVSLMSSIDQLVAYSARKCLEVLVLNLATEDPSRIACLLRKAIMSILRADGDWDGGETVSVTNRAIFTPDLLTGILQGRSTGSEDMHRDQTILPCAATSASVEERKRSPAPSLEELSSDFIGVCRDLSKETTLEFCAVFSSPPAANSHQSESATEHQQTLRSWVHSLDISSRHKICHAFLRLLYYYAKAEMKRENTCKLSFVLATLPHLQAMLMNYCHGSGANLKMVFSVMILYLTTCANICETAKRGGENEVDGGLKQTLAASWRRLVADICKGEWLENMPYHKGPVGFGGVAFTSEQTSKKSLEEYSKGDRVMLRKLAQLVILSTELEAASSGVVSLQGYRHLDRVSRFVVSKLRGMSWCEMEMLSRGRWIFEIFGDQDDALVGIMLNLLKISLSSRAQHKETIKSSSSGFTRIDEHISHHDDEIAAGIHTSYILDAHHVFVSFLDHMTWDHSILLDLLISAETDFIEYFIRYLRLVASDWERFVQVQGICRRKKEEFTVGHVDSSGRSVDDDDDDDDENDKVCVRDVHGRDFNEVMENAVDNLNHDNGDKNDVEDEDNDESDVDGQVPNDDYGGREFRKAVENTGNNFNYDNGDDNDDEDNGDSDEDSEVSDSNYCDGTDFNEKFIYNAGSKFSCDNDVTNVNVSRNDKLLGAATDGQEFCGQAVTVGVESSEGVPKKKQKISLEEIQDDIGGKHKSTEKLPLGNVVEACDLYKEPNGDNEPIKEKASMMGCLDDTMTILIRLRLAVERLENKGLFPFSPSPLIRLLIQVEDLYESSD